MKRGPWVAVADVLDDRGRETVRALEGAGGEALYAHLDVTREEDWTAAVVTVTGHFGGLDILLHSVAFSAEIKNRAVDTTRQGYLNALMCIVILRLLTNRCQVG